MAELLFVLRCLAVFAVEYVPPWLLAPFVSPRLFLATEYALVAVLVAIVVLVTRADIRRKGA